MKNIEALLIPLAMLFLFILFICMEMQSRKDDEELVKTYNNVRLLQMKIQERNLQKELEGK